jgi:hypothetical protein
MMEVAQRHGFHFDNVQMPFNIMDARFRSFLAACGGAGGDQAADWCSRHEVLRQWCDSDEWPSSRFMAFTTPLSLRLSVLIAGINTPELLNQGFTAVQGLSAHGRIRSFCLISKTQQAAYEGKYELFKTTAHFDTTARRPNWLSSDSPPVEQLAPCCRV